MINKLFKHTAILFMLSVSIMSNAGNKKLSEYSDQDYFKQLQKNVKLKSGLKIDVKDLNHDGNNEIILENNKIIYVLEPACGGVVNFAFDKYSKTNLVKLRTKTKWGGVFSDCVLPGISHSDWSYSKYNYEILEKGPDRLRVKMFLQGKSKGLQLVSFEKTYILTKDSPVLQVDYRFINDKRNVVPVKYGLWFHSGFGTEKESSRIFYTTPMGVFSQPVGKEMRNYETTRGWNGIVTASGKGCSILVDYRILKQHYFWASDKHYSTVEAHFGIYPVEAGKSLDTTAWLIPFFGVGVPDGISTCMVGSFNLNNKYEEFPAKFNLNLKALKEGQYTINCRVRHLPTKKWKQIISVSKDFGTSPQSIAVEFNPIDKGSYVFHVSAEKFGEKVFDMEKCVDIGFKTGKYTMKPLVRKLQEPEAKKAEKTDLEFKSLEYVTKHVNWAKPFTGGRPKVLFLGLRRGAIRESIEMAERFDMEIENSYISCFLSKGLFDIGAYFNFLDKNKVLLEVRKKITQNKYDCFVISSELWNFFNDNIKDEITQRVKAGTGLVLTAPEGINGMLDKKLILPENAQRIKGFWQSPKKHLITSGVPFEALPATLALPYKTSGKVIATVENKPLISIFKYGKGRVAASSWVVGGKHRSGYFYKYSGRTFLTNLLYTNIGDINYDYWEYQFSLLARMIYWAARCDFRVVGQNMQIKDFNLLSMEIINKGSSEKLSAELTIRDKFYNVNQQQELDIEIKQGCQNQVFKFAKPTMDGLYFADLIIKSKQGTEWWGTTSFNIDSKVKISKIYSPQEVWKKNEDFKCKINIDGRDFKNKKLEVSLIDSYNRLFVFQTRALAPEVELSLPLKNSCGLIFNVSAEIKQGGKVISKQTKQFILHGAPDANKMQVAFGWPWISLDGYHRFLIRDYFSRLKTLGATAIQVFRHDTKEEVWEARYLNLPILKSPFPRAAGSKLPYSPKAVSSKFDLIREPCLSDPDVLKALENANAGISWQDQYGALYRGGQDEANYILKWEGCYSKFCQSKFRTWLKEQYKSLKALNLEWDTNYSDWQQVFAMTAEEVKERNSYAPWLDHRTFNEHNWALAQECIKHGANRHMPGTRISLSGTSETNPFNAWNWYYLMKVLGAVECYEGEQNIMQRCFKQCKLYWQPWIGYNSEREMLDWQIMNYLFQGATGFSVYSGKFNLNPDLSISRGGFDLKAALDVFKNGKSEVIINSAYKAYPIAFLYSPASIKTNWMLENFELYESEISGMKVLLEDSSCDYDYIAWEQIENSNLLQEKYKILYLPLSTALSDAAINKIEGFVKNGGILVADMAPGIFSEHGKKREHTRLDMLFGINSKNAKIISSENKISGKEEKNNTNLSGFEMSVSKFEIGLKCTTGTPLANIKYRNHNYPSFILNKYGKGYALYIGSSLLSSFGNLKEARYFPEKRLQTKILTSLIKSLFKKVGIKTFVHAVSKNEEKLAATKYFLRQNEEAYIVGIVRDYRITPSIDSQKHQATIKVFDNFHCYDLLTNKYLGFGNSFKTEVGPFTQKAYALIPYKVSALKITSPEIVESDKEYTFTVSIEGSTDKFVKHTLNISIFGPDGKFKEAYSGIKFAEKGKLAWNINFPLNAQKGDWKIIAKDAMTGVEAINTFKLK